MERAAVASRQLEVDVAEPSGPSIVEMDPLQIRSVATYRPRCLLVWKDREGNDQSRRGDRSFFPLISLVLVVSRGPPLVPLPVISIVDLPLPLPSGATYAQFPERERIKEGCDNITENLPRGFQLAGKLGPQTGTDQLQLPAHVALSVP